MLLFKFNNLRKSYGDRRLFDDASLSLEVGDRCALIGDNGAGKTTLLRIIMGLEDPDNLDFAVQWGHNILPAYLPQDLISLRENQTMEELTPIRQAENKLLRLSRALSEEGNTPELLDAYNAALNHFEGLGGYRAIDNIKRIAAGLGLPEEKLQMPAKDLSGGELMRAALARLLSSPADLLILDEPTNHLDADGLEWLENFLKTTSKSLLFVSHDRHLIDEVATKTAGIEHKKIVTVPGNYSDRKRRSRSLEHERARQLEKARKEMAHQTQVARTQRSHRKIASWKSRLKKIDKLEEQIRDLNRHRPERERQLNFHLVQDKNKQRTDRVLLEAQKVTVDYGPGPLFEPFSMTIREGEKIALVGPNGCGKSSLLKGLSGELPQFYGRVHYAYDLTFATLEQRVRFEDESRTLLQELRSRFPDLSETEARGALARFAFFDLEVFKELAILSGGERTRLDLLLILLEEPDLLILDEPTNHLDLHSREVLEDALDKFQGAILTVSHDRYFLDRIGAEVYGFVDREILPFASYPAYRRTCHKLAAAAETEEQEERRDKAAKAAQEATAAVFDKAELELVPELKKLPLNPKRGAESRQLRAQGNLLLDKLLAEADRLSEEAAALEETFATANDPERYETYAALLQKEQKLSQLYFKLAEHLESVFAE